MNHTLAKMIIKTHITEMISSKYKISLKEARDRLYASNVNNLIDDDETGLYGDSILYIFSLYEDEVVNK